MNIDMAPRKTIIIVGGVSVAWLLITIIIGATGPSPFAAYTYSTYNCTGGSHTWNPNNCNGEQMSGNDTWFIQTFPLLNDLNRYWYLEMSVFSTVQQNPDVPLQLATQITLLGQNPATDGDVWYLMVANNTNTDNVICGNGADGQCNFIVIIYEEVIKYPSYQVQITFPDLAQREWIGDVQFVLKSGSDGFARIEIGFLTTYWLISMAITIFYFFKMRKASTADWSWEQRAMGLLLIGLICNNDIFSPFRYATRGWFFPFMSSLMHVAFSCIVLLFWLLMADKIRREELRVDMNIGHLPKLIVVGVYGILTLILFAWASIADEEDPVTSNDVGGIQVMFYIVSIIWVAIIIWIVILAVLTIPVVVRKGYLMNRFLFFAIPTGICILSVLIGIFSGTIGSVNKTTLAFVYLTSMFNVYVYMLLWGYWPAKDVVPSDARDPTTQTSEESPLYYNFGTNPQRKV